MKRALFVAYSIVFFVYSIVILPICILFYETASWEYRQIIGMFVVPLLAGIILAYPFNQWGQKVNRKSSIHLFNAPFIIPVIFVWAFVVYGSIYHQSRFPVYLYQKSPISIINYEPISENAFGFVQFQNVTTLPELQNVFVYNDFRIGHTTADKRTISSKVRRIVTPLISLNNSSSDKIYWFANRFEALDTFSYIVSASSNTVGYINRDHKEIGFYKKAIENGLKEVNIEVSSSPIFLDQITNLEESKEQNKASFFILYGLFLLIMIIVWAVSLKYLQKGVS
jgi:hypothetical protein